MPKYVVFHICDYSAAYRGNFMDSLASLEKYQDVKNIYLFPHRVRNGPAKKWIDELNKNETVAYIQEKNLFGNFFLTARILKKHKVDRIIRHFSDLRIDFVIKLLFNSKHIIRFFHCGYHPQKKDLRHRIRRFLWKNNKLVGVSDAIAAEVKQSLPDFEVVSIVNAICFERLVTTEPFPESNKISFLMMGWDKERKGVDLAVKALERLNGKYGFVLKILGGSEEETVKQFVIKALGKDADWIVFLPATNNIGNYYAANDIFLSPSRQEAFGYAAVEAAYCGNSIVLSKVDGQGELKIDGVYWVEPESIDDLTDKLELAMIELHTQKKIAQRERVKLQVQEIYSLQEWSKKVTALF